MQSSLKYSKVSFLFKKVIKATIKTLNGCANTDTMEEILQQQFESKFPEMMHDSNPITLSSDESSDELSDESSDESEEEWDKYPES